MPLSPAAIIARAVGPASTPLGVLAHVLDRATIPAPKNSPASQDFWNVWLDHLGYLRAHSLRYAGGNLADAEDALSEAMLKAAQSFQREAIRNQRAWLLRLVHNACMDRHRNHRRDSRFVKDIGDIDCASAPAITAPPDRSPEEHLSASEEFGVLARAMSALPAFLAEPLLLYLDEESDADIAARLNVTKEVVRKRRQMAREILRRAIQS
jgi:RNA polymerase sigma factor (sigma-70 family)